MSLLDSLLADVADEITRAPPMPMESVRRVVSMVLARESVRPLLQKVEAFLARSQKSLYDGSISFYDALMAVFPRGKSIKVSRAAFSSSDGAKEAKCAALLLSWAATCELWCSEYEDLRRLIGSSERTSAYAVARATGFLAAYKTTDVWGAQQGALDDNAKTEAGSPIDLPDQLATMTRQVLWVRPFVWHKELDERASLADPVIFATKPAGGSTFDYWTQAYEALWSGMEAVVYVDGAALKARDIFKTAMKQLSEEVDKLFPKGVPKYRRGVCPVGTQYVVTFNDESVPPGPLDNAIRAALRKYGAIEGVKIICKEPQYELDVIPADGSVLY
jgi:hypothetical protein